jgi:hypothetical protein
MFESHGVHLDSDEWARSRRFQRLGQRAIMGSLDKAKLPPAIYV